MLEKYHKLQLKPKMTNELKVALQTIWEELPQERVNKAVHSKLHQVPDCGCQYSTVITLSICSNSVRLHVMSAVHPHLITKKLAVFRATNRLPVNTTLGMLRNGGCLG